MMLKLGKMSSLTPQCKNCKAETKYVCFICQGPTCNRLECSVFLPEETVNWKAGISVFTCLPCKEESKHHTDTPKHFDTSKIVPNTTQTSRTKS